MDKQPVGQLPDLTQSNNDDEIMVITNSEYNQLKKEKISDLITDFTSTNENNALTKGTDGKMFVTDFGNASNITEGTLPTSVLPEIPLEKIPDIPKDKLPPIETSDLPVSGVSADTYAYPSSVTVNAQGQVTGIVEGAPGANNANQDLSNLSETGEKHFLNKSQITNCILEIPQNIMLEINNGQIILKSGSKLYFPNGTGNFDVVTTTEDKNLGAAASSETYLLTVTKNLVPRHAYKKTIYSGNTEPDLSSQTSKFAIWYDTTNNVIKQTSDKGASWTGEWSFPICEYICSEPNKAKSVTTIFNGIGYIGSTVFVLPGVKGLISNNRNADGTLNNIENTITSCKTLTFTTNGEYYLMARNLGLAVVSASQYVYNGSLNAYYRTTDNIKIDFYKAARFSIVNNKIAFFEPSYPFRAVDYNDFAELKDNSANTSLTNLTNGLANVICTTAPTTTSTASSQNPAVVIENYVNGTSGYRVYSDGYCEQWGKYTEATTNNTTINLLKNYNNINYSIFLSLASSGTSINNILGEPIDGSSFNLFCESGERTRGNYWKTCGYIS